MSDAPVREPAARHRSLWRHASAPRKPVAVLSSKTADAAFSLSADGFPGPPPEKLYPVRQAVPARAQIQADNFSGKSLDSRKTIMLYWIRSFDHAEDSRCRDGVRNPPAEEKSL